MTYDYTTYNVTVRLLTPLHIGSGNQLLKDYDYAVHKGRTWRINEDTLLDAQDVDDPAFADTLAKTPPAQLLQANDYQLDSPMFRYTLAGQPRATGQGSQLQEQVKTVQDEIYLPGSSLKGAIRTALAWQGWTEKQLKPSKSDLERSPRYAGRRIEKEIMGSDPNHDLLRALQVGDSQAAGKDKLLLVNVQVLTKGSLGSPIELEAIEPDTAFNLTVKVDKALFGAWAKDSRLRLGGNSSWLDQLPQIIQAHTTQRLRTEMVWYKESTGSEQIVSFYQQMLNAKLASHSCLLQLGWGTGWGDKTYGNHLQNNRPFMEYLISNYRLAKGRRQPGDDFPKSRRSVVQVVKDRSGRIKQKPAVPLGWVLMEMKERK